MRIIENFKIKFDAGLKLHQIYTVKENRITLRLDLDFVLRYFVSSNHYYRSIDRISTLILLFINYIKRIVFIKLNRYVKKRLCNEELSKNSRETCKLQIQLQLFLGNTRNLTKLCVKPGANAKH